MFGKLFEIMIDLVASVIQLILMIPNSLITQYFPDIADTLTNLTNTLSTIFNGVAWAIGILPQSFITILLLIIGIEIAKFPIGMLLHSLANGFKLLKNIKFW